MPIVIPISGKAESGKDLSATLLKLELKKQGKRVLIINYADQLKFLCQKYFGWDGEKDIKGRTLLQKIGTEKVRTKNNNFWVDNVIQIAKVFEDDFDYILIPDCRFENEVTRWIEEGFNTISLRVTRLNHKNKLTQEQRLHPSETSLDNYPFDYYIESETKEEKLEEIIKFVKFLKERFND